ncbi:MAG: TolC family protein [Phycisphaerae bacterium]
MLKRLVFSSVLMFLWVAASQQAAADPGVRVQSQGVVNSDLVPTVAQETPADPIGDLTSPLPLDRKRILWHVADPLEALPRVAERLGESLPKADRKYYSDVQRLLARIERPNKLNLTLEDALRRAMTHNFTVRISSYNPAVDTARIVEAEAAFDTSFFASVIKNKQNRPTANALIGSNVDTLTLNGGLRKLLPTGMLATTSLNWVRNSNDFQFQQLNPQYTSAFVVEFRQPFLRGFGIDFNRSAIRLSQLDEQRSQHAFRREVIDVMVNLEKAYWDLVRARREVVISGRLLASFERIYNFLWQRREFDAYKIQIADTKARLEKTKASFIQVETNVRNAEDALINQMNDPQIDLADDIEIVPTDFPHYSPVVLDRLSEVQIALDHRHELAEADLAVRQARVRVGQAKNGVLPQLDVTFRYTVDGLGESGHDAFSEVTKNDFHEYFISVEFEIPVGNRAARAREVQARLRHGQAIAALKQTYENVILDVNVRLRQLAASFDQLGPNYESAEANQDQVDAIVARAESRNFVQLNQELNALTALAGSRRELIQSLIDYNMAIIQLERAKGTLPEYDNIILNPQPE